MHTYTHTQTMHSHTHTHTHTHTLLPTSNLKQHSYTVYSSCYLIFHHPSIDLLTTCTLSPALNPISSSFSAAKFSIASYTASSTKGVEVKISIPYILHNQNSHPMAETWVVIRRNNKHLVCMYLHTQVHRKLYTLLKLVVIASHYLHHTCFCCLNVSMSLE